MKLKLCYLIITNALLLSSCATIMHGTHQNIGIASNPSNASVWLDRNYVGNTPIVVEMSRKDNHLVRIELPGYHPYEATFTRQMSGWVFGNLAFGGIIGLAVDAITGGLYVLTPEQIQAEMRSCHFASNETEDSFIAIVLEPNPSWQKVGNLIALN